MLGLVAEYFTPTAPVPLAFSASSPVARRAAEGSSLGFVIQGLRTHFEPISADAELSSSQRPLRTICIHAEALPQSFFNALWWIRKDGAAVPVAFRGARLSGTLCFGAPTTPAAPPSATATTPASTSAVTPVSVVSVAIPALVDIVQRCISLFLAGSRLRELQLNPAVVPLLERLDISNCRCLRTVRWCDDAAGSAFATLKLLKASRCGVMRLPGPTLGAWAPTVTAAHLSGCRTLGAEHVDRLLDGASAVKVARLDGTRLTTLRSVVASCPYMSELKVSGCTELREVRQVATQLLCLRTLDLHGCCALTSLHGVGGSRKLRCLDVSHCPRLTTLAPLAEAGGLPALQHFNASYCAALRDTHLEMLRGCAMLTTVKVSHCAALADFAALSRHPYLTLLHANDTKLASVAFLQRCTMLQEVSVAGCTQLHDLDPLRGLQDLVSVDACFSGVTRVAEVVDQCDSLRLMLVRECELDAESTDRLEACATRVASTHRNAHRTGVVASAAM